MEVEACAEMNEAGFTCDLDYGHSGNHKGRFLAVNENGWQYIGVEWPRQ